MVSEDKRSGSSLSVQSTPEPLREAALRGKLVIFVGAGVSRLAGAPSWNQFADGVLEQLRAKGLLNHAELEQLRTYPPKTRLSIAKDIARQSKETIDYRSLVQPREPIGSDLEIFRHLVSIGTPFVTTNYDGHIESISAVAPTTPAVARGDGEKGPPESPTVRKPKSICRAEDFGSRFLYEPGSVIHLHGSLDDVDSMIISAGDYLLHYSKESVRKFLDTLFEEFTVLFVGYGLDELEILEYVFLKRRPIGAENAVGQHYLLFPMFSYEKQLLERLKGYYRTLNVELIEYYRDRNNYRELIEVMAQWSKEITYRPPGFSEKVKLIERAFSD